MKKKSLIHVCLFPTAGYGTRFLPATKAMPKEMLPILTKPLIQYGVIVGEEIEPAIYRVSRMFENPAPSDAPSNLAIIGRYIRTPDIFDILHITKSGRGGEIQITDALMEQARSDNVSHINFEANVTTAAVLTAMSNRR
ncbi:MAG: hypothetical protein A3G19_03035 [Sulfuricurvum sp. RIFCSPLOWO2_12_FULL_43_24]|nr:MAG: hypothetical protein A3G19_03035 [Sulfuricurvum sp. RIFCSPLOWO2_12_FULL_43_24]